jgi:purine-binding chemotaxis protein CheW
MNNLTISYENILENENLYLHFKFQDNKYALNIKQIVEIMKLPLLDYPQKLPNNVIGLLNYNNFTINILDIRFYLNLKITPYSVSNQLLIVKTDESLLGLIIDKVEDIVPFDQSKVEYIPSSSDDKIIEFMYKKDGETISIINLNSLENIIKQGVASDNIDIPSLFPHDDDSQYELMQRSLILQNKMNTNMVSNAFSQDQFISFSLNESLYCINLEYVKEFLKSLSITKIPCNAEYISGVIVLRGDFINIIDIKKFFGMEDLSTSQTALTGENKNNIIVVETPDYKIGFLVDEILDIINIPEELIQPNSNNQDKYISNEVVLEDKFYTILNIKNILSDEKFYIEE